MPREVEPRSSDGDGRLLAIRPDRLGALISSSRGVLFPFRPDDTAWETKIETALSKAIAALSPLTQQ